MTFFLVIKPFKKSFWNLIIDDKGFTIYIYKFTCINCAPQSPTPAEHRIK